MADGLKTALAKELADFGMQPDAAEREQQLMLLEDGLEAAEIEARQAASEPGKVGRPKGARNRSTEQWRKVLFAKHGSPLDAVLTEANKSIEDLKAEYGFSAKDAAHYRMNALQAALPYMHQKQPIAVEAPPGSRVSFNINLGPGDGDQDGEAAADPATQVFSFQKTGEEAQIIDGDVLPPQDLENDDKSET